MSNQLKEKEKVHIKNKDLVTKACGLRSAIDKLKYDLNERDKRIDDLLYE